MRTDTCEDRENYSNTMIRFSVCGGGVPGETTHTQTHTQGIIPREEVFCVLGLIRGG